MDADWDSGSGFRVLVLGSGSGVGLRVLVGLRAGLGGLGFRGGFVWFCGLGLRQLVCLSQDPRDAVTAVRSAHHHKW